MSAAGIDRWVNPSSWEDWKALLELEMKLHDYPFGRNYDPESYRDYYNDSYGPHAAIEEDFNCA